MSYARLEALERTAVAVPRRIASRAARCCTTGSGRIRSKGRARRSRRSNIRRRSTRCHREFPMRLTTGRRLESFNTGVQTGGYTSPLRRGESLDICTGGWRAASASPTGRWCASSRGAARSKRRCAIDDSLRPGPGVHDDALSGRGRDEHPDDRRDRSEVGDGRIQGAAIRVEKLAMRRHGARGRETLAETGTR